MRNISEKGKKSAGLQEESRSFLAAEIINVSLSDFPSLKKTQKASREDKKFQLDEGVFTGKNFRKKE